VQEVIPEAFFGQSVDKLLRSHEIKVSRATGPIVEAVWEEMLVSCLATLNRVNPTLPGTELRAFVSEFIAKRQTLRAENRWVFAWGLFCGKGVKEIDQLLKKGGMEAQNERDYWNSYYDGQEVGARFFSGLGSIRFNRPFFALSEHVLNEMLWLCPPDGGISGEFLSELLGWDFYLVDPGMQWCIAVTHEEATGPFIIRNYDKLSLL
jgi:hypothetical protein